MTVTKDQRIAELEACKKGVEAMLCDGQERIAQLEHAIDKVIETKILEKGAFVLNPDEVGISQHVDGALAGGRRMVAARPKAGAGRPLEGAKAVDGDRICP
jgi:hypothetical protein